MSGLDGLYQQLILDHAREREGEGEITPFDAEHFERNPSCGDEVTLRVRLSEDRSRIEQIGWVGDGCSISMASVSILVGLLEGQETALARRTIDAMRTLLRGRGSVHYAEDSPEAELLGDAVAFEGTARYVMRVKCAMLGWVALEAALTEAGATGFAPSR